MADVGEAGLRDRVQIIDQRRFHGVQGRPRQSEVVALGQLHEFPNGHFPVKQADQEGGGEDGEEARYRVKAQQLEHGVPFVSGFGEVRGLSSRFTLFPGGRVGNPPGERRHRTDIYSVRCIAQDRCWEYALQHEPPVSSRFSMRLRAASWLALGRLLGRPVWADIYAYTAPDGTVTLSNMPTDDRYTVLVAAVPQA